MHQSAHKIPLVRRVPRGRLVAAGVHHQPFRNLPQMCSSTTKAMKSRLSTKTVVGPLHEKDRNEAAGERLLRDAHAQGGMPGHEARASPALLPRAHLQPWRIVRVEAQDAAAGAAASGSPGHGAARARGLTGRSRPARRPRATGPLGQSAAAGLPLTRLPTRDAQWADARVSSVRSRPGKARRPQASWMGACRLIARSGAARQVTIFLVL